MDTTFYDYTFKITEDGSQIIWDEELSLEKLVTREGDRYEVVIDSGRVVFRKIPSQ